MKLKVEQTISVFDFLIASYPEFTRGRIRQLLKYQKVTRRGEALIRADTPVHAGDELEVDVRRAAQAGKRFPPGFPVHFEDEFLIVAEKPPGVITVGEASPRNPSFLSQVDRYVMANAQDKVHAYLVHRLDREVSGLLIFAKSRKIQEDLKEHWRDYSKQYMAIVEGRPKEKSGVLRDWLRERDDQRVEVVPEDTPHARLCTLKYEVVKWLDQKALLEITLETGRKNQIRVQLAAAGHPVVGDRRYGANAEFVRRIRLHATTFTFIHPITGMTHTVRSAFPPVCFKFPLADERY